MRPNFFQTSFKNIPKQGRILGIDYGEKSVGVSITNLSQSIANPFTQIATHEIFGNQGILTLINQERAVAIVFGWPIYMDGSHSPMCEKVSHVAKVIHDLYPNLPIFGWDERLTSKETDNFLGSVFSSFSKKQDKKDKVAASLILSSFLGALRASGR